MRPSFNNVPVSRSRRIAAKLLSILTALILGVGFSQSAHADYPYARVTNNTPYTVTGEVQYVSFACKDDSYRVAPGQTWTASSRGICLIDDITGTMHGAVGQFGESATITPYNASPATSYSRFQINAYSGSFRIFSADEWDDVSDTKHGKSPGFYFVNKTEWPLTYSLDQVGCLYHGIIPTGEGKGGVLKVDTGAVWFTMKIAIQPDGVDPVSNWDCVKPVAELVADVALAAATGGGSAVSKAGGKLAVSTIVKEVVKAGAKEAVKSAAKKVITDLAKDELGKILTKAGSVELYGQYAGYEWPFRCDKMPEYHITGGPEPQRDEDGVVYLKRGVPFKVKKVNTCGNDMMTGSKREMESDQSSFSDWPGGGANSIVESGHPSCVTFYAGTNASGAALQLCGITDSGATYMNLGNNNNSHHAAVKSFRCNSGVKSIQFINGNANPWERLDQSCKGGNVVNANPWAAVAATGVSIWGAYCCGEGPKPLTAAQKAEIAAIRAREAAAVAAQQKADYDAAIQSMVDTQNAWMARLRKDRMVFADTNLENCALRGTVQSVAASSIPTIVLNLGADIVNVHVVNADGEEGAPLTMLGPSTDDTIEATQGAWIVGTNSEGACVGLGMPGEPDNQIIFNSDKSAPPSEYDNLNQGNIDADAYFDAYLEDIIYAEDSVGEPEYTEGPGCGLIGQIVSPDDGEAVTVKFSNSGNTPVHIMWLNTNGESSDFSGEHAPVATVPAQGEQEVNAKNGHIFIGTDQDLQCLGLVEVAAGEPNNFAFAGP